MFRPQILVLVNNYPDMEVKHSKLLAFTSQLKAGRGLTVLASVLEGDITARRDDALKSKEVTKQQCQFDLDSNQF